MIMISNTNKGTQSMYSPYASFIFIFLFSFLTSFTASAQVLDPKLIAQRCPNTTTYSRNSTYFTNLTTLLSSLSSGNASHSTGFQTATAGQDPDRVTGLFLCRGDVSPEVCNTCVTFSTSQTLDICPDRREVVLYYDECMLRYSHRNILSTVTVNSTWSKIMWRQTNISSDKVKQFEKLVSSMMNQAATEAASSPRKFLTRKANWTASQTLYGLVQCTPDLTSQDCVSCLQQSINGLPFYKEGARNLFPSCSSRYELYPFYNETSTRTPPSSPQRPGKGGISGVLVASIVVPIVVAVLLFIAGYCFLTKRTKKSYAPAFDGDDIATLESLQLDYRTILAATNDYSVKKRIGRGGFGVVYKGTFSNGTEVAVKRLSKTSGQGEAEFKNEVIVVAKLQHRNLVRLLGFSLEGEERILVYEYVPNKSLDYFLFDHAKQSQLDWTRRYNIIGGIVRGILYLHQDSRLTVIHRDLKASNILLDSDMNPKIADFGMARIFGMDQTQENTSRIVGTYGYMSPEYAIRGQFSVKSDVYSFGVLVLEIISGRKNSSFYDTDDGHDLVTYAFSLWSNGTMMDLVDPNIVYNCQRSEVVRCIHIGLLCVQEDPVDRPTLAAIAQMLTNNTVTLPAPREPGLFFQSRPIKVSLDVDPSTTNKSVPASNNGMSITDLYPR